MSKIEEAVKEARAEMDTPIRKEIRRQEHVEQGWYLLAIVLTTPLVVIATAWWVRVLMWAWERGWAWPP